MSKYVGTDGYKFKVEPDLLNNKVTEVNNALILIAGIIKEIEDIFQEITNGEMWLGPLSENFKEEFNKFLTSNSSEESMTTAGGANAVSSSVENYSQVLRTFLNDASGGYFFADEEAAKFRSLVGESTTISPEQVNGKTTMSDATNDVTSANSPATATTSNNGNVDTSVYKNKPEQGFVVTTDNKTYELSDEDRELLYKVVASEAQKDSYDDALAVTSVILNRADGGSNDPIDVITAKGQFEGYYAGYYKTAKVTPEVKKAVDDGLAGVRNNEYRYFVSKESSASKYGNNMISEDGNRYRSTF